MIGRYLIFRVGIPFFNRDKGVVELRDVTKLYEDSQVKILKINDKHKGAMNILISIVNI